MGEAKRRKKLNSSYGKVPSLKTLGAKEKYFGQLLDDLHSQCESEIRTLTGAQKIPDDYEEIRDRLGSWVKNRLSKYREEDRKTIANNLLFFCAEMSEEYDSNTIILLCFLDILKSDLSSELSEELVKGMEDILANLEVELERRSKS